MKTTKQKDKFGGEFYLIEMPDKKSNFDFATEKIENLDAFCASYMKDPFFMGVKSGGNADEIPYETQWLAIRHTDNTYTLYYSLASDTFRTAFHGKDGCVCVSATTGDEDLSGNSFYAFYKISGTDFYEMTKKAAESISEKYPNVGLKKDKKDPNFIDYFGWCTWDSFYDSVSKNDLRRGLESFKNGGFVPKFVILDDGWQTVAEYNARGEWKLSSFTANEKFNHNLIDTTKMAKEEYGVEKFFVWHAMVGYWGGTDTVSEEMKKYKPVLSNAVHTDGMKIVNPSRWQSENFPFGIIDPDMAYDFYNDYHTYLKNEGIDGVKVDVQGSIPAHGNKRGGRCGLVKKFRTALERSVNENFNGNIINCMSNNNDTVYNLKNTNMMRSSDDFFPAIPESHSVHVFTNAINSIWLSEFTGCDWDMFQTKHEFAKFHAAARAISGGPIYVSDKVDEHDYDVIARLTSDDGKIFRAKNTARPTVDSIFSNPSQSKDLFKIFNENEYNGVVGVFSFDNDTEKTVNVYPTDIVGYTDGDYICYSCKDCSARILKNNEPVSVTLKKTEFDLLTFAKITDGFAVIGLTNKFNCGGTFDNLQKTDSGYSMHVKASGELLLYCNKNIKSVISADGKLPFSSENGFVKIDIEKACDIEIVLA